jgi:hypothetical protein
MATYSVTRAPNSYYGVDWSNLTNLKFSDDQYASVLIEMDMTASLILYDFGFVIPSGAVINGIQVSIEAHTDTINAMYLSSVYLGFYDGLNFVTKGSAMYDTTYFTLIDSIYTVGSSSDLWGTTWTYNDINQSSFGCQITIYNNSSSSAYAYVDYVDMTITYTISGTTYQLSASIPLQTTFTPRLNVNKKLQAVVQSSTSIISDLIIRGKQLLNAIISTSTTFLSSLKVNHTLNSVFVGKTQVSSFTSIKKALQSYIPGRTLFTGTINRVKHLVSNITMQTILTAQLIVPRLLSAIISGKTSFVSQIRIIRNFASKVIGKTTIQAQLISVQLLNAVISSATQMKASLKKTIRMFASFAGKTIFIAIPTFWSKIKRYSATWQQKNMEVKTWKRIK